jgi:hypothetical protein
MSVIDVCMSGKVTVELCVLWLDSFVKTNLINILSTKVLALLRSVKKY